MAKTIRRIIEVETDPDQAWFWSDQWQAMEREADREIDAGEGIIFESDEAFLASLRERLKSPEGESEP